MAKILMVNHSTIPDIRIDREAAALGKAGHDVYLICSGKKKYGEVKGVYKEIFFLPIDIHIDFLIYPFKARKAAQKCKKIIKKIKPDIVHVHDIKAASIIQYIISKEIPLIFDDHEIAILSRKMNLEFAGNFFKKIVHLYRYYLMKNYFRKITKKADLIVVVNKKVVDFYQELEINPKKMIVIENYASAGLYKKAINNKHLIDDFFIKDSRKKIIHISKGAKLSNSIVRDISLFIEAATELDDWVVVVFGPYDEAYDQFDIEFIPPKPREEYLACCAQCDIALNTLTDTQRAHFCSSNRLFEFVALGLRVISTKVDTLVEKFDNYLFWMDELIEKEDVINLLENIDRFPSAEEIRRKAKEFTWEAEVVKLVNKYDELLTK